jgi:hypothetical protein
MQILLCTTLSCCLHNIHANALSLLTCSDFHPFWFSCHFPNHFLIYCPRTFKKLLALCAISHFAKISQSFIQQLELFTLKQFNTCPEGVVVNGKRLLNSNNEWIIHLSINNQWMITMFTFQMWFPLILLLTLLKVCMQLNPFVPWILTTVQNDFCS